MALPIKPLPLGRFPLIATRDHVEGCQLMDSRVGGRRTVMRVAPGGSPYNVNFLRLGPTGLMAMGVSPSVLRSEGDAIGMFYLSRSGGIAVEHGGRSLEVPEGSVGCLVPGGDRLLRYSENCTAMGIRIAPEALHGCMEAHGHAPAQDWSNVFASVSADVPQAARLMRFVETVVAIYDDPEEVPDRRADIFFGRSIALRVAELLVAVSRQAGGPAVPSYRVAARTEEAIVRRFAEPITITELAASVGAAPGVIRASMVRHRGVTVGEFLAFVRIVAVEEFVRRGAAQDDEAPAMAGFLSRRSYLRALAKRDEWRARLGARGIGSIVGS